MRRLPWALLLASACVGQVGDPAADPSAPPGPAPVTPPTPPEAPPFEPAPATLLRLTRRQYLASVRALLGPDIALPADLETDTPLFGFSTVGASRLAVGPLAAEQYEAAALGLARQVFAAGPRREAFVGCAPSGPADPCIRAFVERFGRRVFRRPLTTEELERWAGLASALGRDLGDPWRGLELTTAGLLQSPFFLYRVELGGPDPADPERRRRDGFELASRLSYFVLGATPDDALLEAAARGDLDRVEGIEAETRRLLALPGAREGLLAFFSEHLKLDRLDGLTRSPETFPEATPTLGASMREEILRRVEVEVLAPGADLRGLLLGRTVFVNDDLARIYHLPSRGPALERAELPAGSPRRGVLTAAGFLALNAHPSVTSPTLRGRFIRQSLLCQDVPPPPASVSTELPEPEPGAAKQTLRQRLETLHLANPTCAACHRLMDPLGFGLEAFDAVGAYRTTDHGLPVDTRGQLDGEPFDDAVGLAETIAAHPGFARCLARVTYRYASGHLETEGETRTIDALVAALTAAGHRFDALVVAIATSEGFRFARPED